MGLAISVGVLADLLIHDAEGAEWMSEDLAAANRVLVAAGLPAHDEPRQLPPLAHRAALRSMPYSFIHHLRRAYAHCVNTPEWIATPLPEGVDPAQDPVLDAEVTMFSSHLLCHSDAEGFYLPIDFTEVLFDESDDHDLPGGMLGSSYRLRDELVRVAPSLGIALQGDALSDAEAARIGRLTLKDEGLYRELASWLALYEAARLSIEHKTAVVLH